MILVFYVRTIIKVFEISISFHPSIPLLLLKEYTYKYKEKSKKQ